MVAVAAVLVGCGKMTSENRKSFAQSECLFRASEAFPELGRVDTASADEAGNSQDGQVGRFRELPAAGFEWTVSLAALGMSGSGELTCAGSFETPQVKEITFNGVTRRPQQGEIWSF